MAEACPLCGTALVPDAGECPHCGARIDRSGGPVDQLLVGLDDLTRSANAELAQAARAQVRAADRAIGEFEAIRENFADPNMPGAGDPADLRGFVRRVRASGLTRDLVDLPPRNPWSTPIIAFGALLAAMGVFRLATEPYFGALALLGGAATMGIGSVLYRIRPAAQ